MIKNTAFIAALVIGGYLIYRAYKKKNEVIVRSGSMEYIIEKQQ